MPDRINILLIGGGAREHALAVRIKASPLCAELFITHPENPGLASLGRAVDVPVAIREIYRLQQFCDKNKIGLVVIGPEDPLSEGYADKLAAPGRLIFGPTQEAARLESDKAWCKSLLRAASVPTGEARVFTDPESARAYIESRIQDDKVLAELFKGGEAYRDPENRRKWINQQRGANKAVALAYAAIHDDLPVIKASGLAKGKGVVVPHTLAEALDAVERIMIRREFGPAGSTVLIEERLTGPEVSVMALVDGRNILMLPTAQDHKRLGDNDTGPNTGGMGAYSPSDKLDEATMAIIEREILVPTVDALRRDGIIFQGVLFAGIMLTPAGPKVLEYNVRFGDPEAQVILARLKSDIVALMLAVCNGTLDTTDIEFDEAASCCIVLAAKGYPDKPKASDEITGIEDAEDIEHVQVLHAGTKRSGLDLVTSGGRVLSVVATGPTPADARTSAYAAANLINFEGKQMRRDIGSTPAPKPARA